MTKNTVESSEDVDIFLRGIYEADGGALKLRGNERLIGCG